MLFFPFASHIDWFRLSIRWSTFILYVRVRKQLVYVHFSLYDISTWHNAIFDEYFLCRVQMTKGTNIQNHNDKMQHRTKRKKKKNKKVVGMRKPKNGAEVHRRWNDIDAVARLIDICLDPTNNGRLIVVNTIDLVVHLDARVLFLDFVWFRLLWLCFFRSIPFLSIVCCVLTVDRDRQSQWNVNVTKYMASS